MKIETQEQLQRLFEKTNFNDHDGPIEWDYIKWSESDGEPYVYIGEASTLGQSCVQCANNNENSNWDHFLIGELVRLYADGKLKIA